MNPPSAARTNVPSPDVRSSENDIKGRVAEALVEQLFRALDWKVLRFGMEHTHPHLFESVRGRDDDVSLSVRSQPDFIVQKPGGPPFFIEVKYRSNGALDIGDVGPNFPPTTFFVLVSPHRIQCIAYSELKTQQVLRPDVSGHYFADRPEFQADKSTVMAFVQLAAKMFEFDKRGGYRSRSQRRSDFRGRGF